MFWTGVSLNAVSETISTPPGVWSMFVVARAASGEVSATRWPVTTIFSCFVPVSLLASLSARAGAAHSSKGSANAPPKGLVLIRKSFARSLKFDGSIRREWAALLSVDALHGGRRRFARPAGRRGFPAVTRAPRRVAAGLACRPHGRACRKGKGHGASDRRCHRG